MAQRKTMLDALKDAYHKNGFKPRSIEAQGWLFDKVHSSVSYTSSKLLNDKSRQVKTPFIGNMFFFAYEAKYKDTLPYWDKFPLVFPIEFYGDSMLGLNLHYLDYMHRAQLMDVLYTTATDKRYDANTRLRLSYELLKGTTKYKGYMPCVKKYLFSHVQSKFVNVSADEWEISLFLPVAKFVGASEEKVWSDSLKKIG